MYVRQIFACTTHSVGLTQLAPNMMFRNRVYCQVRIVRLDEPVLVSIYGDELSPIALHNPVVSVRNAPLLVIAVH